MSQKNVIIRIALVIIILVSIKVVVEYRNLSLSSIHPRDTIVERRIESAEKVNIEVTNVSIEHRHPAQWKRMIADITQNKDLGLRGKWQMTQVERYCKKYGLENQHLVLPMIKKERRILLQHLLCDPKRKLVYCVLPKAGCTSMKRLFLAMQGEIPVESIKWWRVSETQYLIPAIARTSLQNKNLTEEMRLYRLKTYFKFVVIRNPLERLVSAYRNKIEPPLEFSKHDTRSNPLVTNLSKVKLEDFQARRRLILSKYNPEALVQWAKANGTYQLSVSFSTYVRWIVDSKDSSLNEHFSSILWNIAPCRVGYNLFLNFKNYSRDVRLLMSKLNISSDLFIDHNAHSSPEKETHSTLPHYYSQLSRELKRRLFVARRRELDFYYYLYPEEQLSHVELLGIKNIIGPLKLDSPT